MKHCRYKASEPSSCLNRKAIFVSGVFSPCLRYDAGSTRRPAALVFDTRDRAGSNKVQQDPDDTGFADRSTTVGTERSQHRLLRSQSSQTFIKKPYNIFIPSDVPNITPGRILPPRSPPSRCPSVLLRSSRYPSCQVQESAQTRSKLS